MISAALAWIGKIVPLEKIALILLAISLACALWFYVAMHQTKADAAMTRADNSRLLDSISAKNAAIEALRLDVSNRDAVIAKRDARISELHTAAIEAATDIQGASNDNPDCDIDARLPASLSQPLCVLYAKAANRDGSGNHSAAPAINSVSAQNHAGTAVNNDSAQSRAVGGKTDHLGR